MLMNDPGIFGGGPFLSVESASIVLALEPLLHGTLQIEEIILHGPELQLTTTASGQHNWEYGFTSRQTQDDEPHPPSNPNLDGDGVIPLADPAHSNRPAPGFFSRLVVHVNQLTCTDARVQYRDLRSGAFYKGGFDGFSVSDVRRNTDMPMSLKGSLKDENMRRSLWFSLNATARLDSEGIFAASVKALDLETDGIGDNLRRLRSRGEIRYSRAARTVDIRDLHGSLDGKTSFGGCLSLARAEAKTPARFTGEITADGLDLDALLDGLSPSPASPDAEEVKGAPNLTRPRVSALDRPSPSLGSPRDTGAAGPGMRRKSGKRFWAPPGWALM